MGKLKIYEVSKEELAKLNYAKFTTENGEIWIKLYNEDAPNTVANFAHLVSEGFYNGLIFHRVISGFMAQGGCPQGRGTGGPGWEIPCELENNKNRHLRGALSMAHRGRDTGGSQFFICFVPCPHLDGEHTVFGQIELHDLNSFKALDSVNQGDKIVSVEILENR